MKTKSNLFVIIAALLCLASAAHAATLRVWSGSGADNFWATAANWTNNAAPVTGDDLLFPAGTARLSNSNNLTTNMTLGSITFSGSNYVINGNAITNGSGLTNTPVSGTNTFNCAIALSNNVTFTIATNSSFNLGSALNTSSKILTCNVIGDMTASGVISAGGILIKIGAGALTLSGANTYFGSTSVGAGRLTLANSAALGGTSSTVVQSVATVALQSNISVTTSQFILNGTLDNVGGTNIFASAIQLGLASIVNVTTNTSLILSNALTGSGGGFTKTGPGPLTLSSNTNNSYTAATTVNEGQLILNKPAGSNAIPGALIIGDGSGGVNADIVWLAAGNQIANTGAVTIASSGLLDLNGFSDTIGSLAGSGNATNSAGTLTTGGDDSSTSFSGILSGP